MPSSDPLSTGALVILAAAAAVDDILTAKVHNLLTYPAIVLGLGLAATGPRGLESAVLGLAVGLLLLMVAWSTSGLGQGDAKLVMAIGCLTDGLFTLQVVVYGSVVAATLALMMIIAHGELGLVLRRFAAALGLLAHAPDAPPRALPGGFCLCLGTFWVMMELRSRTTLWDALTTAPQ